MKDVINSSASTKLSKTESIFVYATVITWCKNTVAAVGFV